MAPTKMEIILHCTFKVFQFYYSAKYRTKNTEVFFTAAQNTWQDDKI